MRCWSLEDHAADGVLRRGGRGLLRGSPGERAAGAMGSAAGCGDELLGSRGEGEGRGRAAGGKGEGEGGGEVDAAVNGGLCERGRGGRGTVRRARASGGGGGGGALGGLLCSRGRACSRGTCVQQGMCVQG
jgi:hypothetical protein